MKNPESYRLLLLEMLSGVIAFWRYLTDFFCVDGSRVTNSQLRLMLRIGLKRIDINF